MEAGEGCEEVSAVAGATANANNASAPTAKVEILVNMTELSKNKAGLHSKREAVSSVPSTAI
jgi:hypothetical protein